VYSEPLIDNQRRAKLWWGPPIRNLQDDDQGAVLDLDNLVSLRELTGIDADEWQYVLEGQVRILWSAALAANELKNAEQGDVGLHSPRLRALD